MSHAWHFFRAGAVDQVSLRDGGDVVALSELDQKLWVALAMPTRDIDLDPVTLDLLDYNKDGRIRIKDILDAVTWIENTFVQPNDVLKSAETVALSAIKDAKVVAAARRMLHDLGKQDAASITVADTLAITSAFVDTVLNGDGIVIPASATDPALREAIEIGIARIGGVADRSGKSGLDQARVDELFAEVDRRKAWLDAGAAAATLGEATGRASDALAAVRAKLEDYFTRCQLAAFEPRAAAALSAADTDVAALSGRLLSGSDDDVARLPIAAIDPAGRLPLAAAVNPAWRARLAAFAEHAVVPILGARDVLTAAELAAICDKLAAHDAWRAARPVTKVDTLDAGPLATLADPGPRAALAKLITADAALAEEYELITAVTKVARFQRDFGRILRNFVNFSDFYSRRDGVFQAGTLYLDGRALHLCVHVSDAARHAALAAASDAFLIYCDIQREGVTDQIAALLTNGDSENVFVGRNGIFYDRKGNDWDATVTRVVTNPISIREAFWSPYKRLIKTIEDQVAKRAAAADAAANARLEATGKSVAEADKVGAAAAVEAATAPPPAPPPRAAAPEPPPKLDLGAIAAIGLAIGGVSTLLGALFATLFGLGFWMPIGFLGLLLAISGPAMMLAWLKLRRRNLGPILDANGWAINSRARINIAFGAAMTELARLPPGSRRSVNDPYADKRSPWRLYVFVAVLLVLAGSWYVGKFDALLPDAAKSIQVLGVHAPAYKAPAPTK